MFVAPFSHLPPTPFPRAIRPTQARTASSSDDRSASVRVGDRDRERTSALLGQALAQGYLDLPEYEQRLAEVYTAHTGADLRAVTDDLPVSRLLRHDPAKRQARRTAARRSVQAHLAAYLLTVVVVLTVWLAVALTAGAWYFWPVWPILGGGIGLLGHAIPVRCATAPRAA